MMDISQSKQDFLWLTRGAFRLCSTPSDKKKRLIVSTWTRSANVNSVRVSGPSQDEMHMLLDSECMEDSTLYHNVVGNLAATGHALFALKNDLMRFDPNTPVDMCDAYPGSDTEDTQDKSGFMRGPSDGFKSRLNKIIVNNLLRTCEYRY